MAEMDLFGPLASLHWVEREKLHANDYNPNKVSEENLQLLTQSILTNGWTLPIVVRPDYTIIDGFHRWTVSGREMQENCIFLQYENQLQDVRAQVRRKLSCLRRSVQKSG